MERVAIFFWSMALCLNLGQAQAKPELDSLLHALPSVQTGPKRIDILNHLASAYTFISIDEAEKYATQAIGYSRETNYPAGLAEGYKILGAAYYVKGEHDKSIEYSYE